MILEGIGELLTRIATGAVVMNYIRNKDPRIADKLYNSATLCEEQGPNAYWMAWSYDISERLKRNVG